MWIYNRDYNKWISSSDNLPKYDFDLLKQEIESTRFYSKCLSGSTYIPIDDLSNIYSILNRYYPKNWYIGLSGSSYSISATPSKYPQEIDASSKYSYYNQYLPEYGLTLKNLFTPNRLIKDSLKNFYYVDVATTESIDLSNITVNLKIDGIRLVEGHKVLIKDQTTNVTLSNLIDPENYFTCNYKIYQYLGSTIEYQYYNEENGIYYFTNGKLVKSTDLDIYEQCIRFGVSVKLGNYNKDREFNLSRLLNGYFPLTYLNQPIEFTEKNNWILRNRVDYNNLFEINYYDIFKHATQSYTYNNITYTIPERLISVGEFGVIVNTQENKSNIIPNKYKVNLRSISETSKNYWVCGDYNTLLKIDKNDFTITKINIDRSIIYHLKSISFYNDLKGVVVGNFNTILVTKNGGVSWKNIEFAEFKNYTYNKVIYTDNNTFYIGGNNGVFIEIKEDINGWTAYKRRISKKVDIEDEFLLVDNINYLYKTSINTWGVTYSYFTQSISQNKELIFIISDGSNIIAYDLNNSFSMISDDFIYFDLIKNYGNILNITRRENTNYFYFTGTNEVDNQSGIFSFDINNFNYIGTGGSYSNIAISSTSSNYEYNIYANKLLDFNSYEIVACGDLSILKYSTYSTQLDFIDIDSTFNDKLKSKLLILDYDIASKLNFFTDDGDYRLPNSVTFSITSLTGSSSSIAFSPIIHTATSSNNGTYSETNWITYWSDTSKVFEFYCNTPLDYTTEVLMSTTFSYASYSSIDTFTSSSITSSASIILNLAPMIYYSTQSRYDSQGMAPISATTSLYSLYLYDYLMIYGVSSSYPANVGDVIRLESSVVDGNFIVNKIVSTFSSKYLYMYTEFNKNIISNLSSSTSSITISNLNTYSTQDELYTKFNIHPISNSYKIDYIDSNGIISSSSSIFQINAQFNSLTSYYNQATNVLINGEYSTMSYTDGFLNFGYSPTYNLLDYLININNVNDINYKFYANKEYLSMPRYENLPIGALVPSKIYIDYNGMTYSGGSMSMPGNKIIFGSDLELEWESILINTFIDINIKTTSVTYSTSKLLVMNKYYNSEDNSYVIEFHKGLNFTIGDSEINGGYLDIISRRYLYQISEDLQELNNIQRSKSRNNSWKDQGVYLYNNYQNELNFKIPTDSYAKILCSDVDTVQQLSAIIYIDYKNELSLNITNLSKEYIIPVIGTTASSGKLQIVCSEEHNLSTGDPVIIGFTGGTGSSQELNNQYFGYHVITKIDEYNLLTEINYGTDSIVPDYGFIKYNRHDPFLNYTPIDIIDLGIDKKPKQSIEINSDNLNLVGNTYSLINIDFSKYRYKLIDGLDIEILSSTYPWILEAEISNAIIGTKDDKLVWYNGIWECGRWFDGIWNSGTWVNGDWYNGIWNSFSINNKLISVEVDTNTISSEYSTWVNGRWYNGTWNNGSWINGSWYDGIWNNGMWLNGTWNDGTWENGFFKGGIWVLGIWNNGIFNCDNYPAYWLDGKWYGGDFENGIWYNGIWDQKNNLSRFGTKSYNSRTSTWHGGKWINGSFYSKMDLDDHGMPITSEVHKYSIWRTGQWTSGQWYGGISYNMDFKTGIWHGGILEDIQVIGINITDSYFVLNGIFKFNIGDNIYIIDNQINNSYSSFGSNSSPGKYKILYQSEDITNNRTNLYVSPQLSGLTASTPIDTGLRVVSRFNSTNWKSGIWTNGIFESGIWESGIWYNGVFNGIWG